MAEYICVLHKDTLILKPPKKSPLFLRMVVLLFAMVCGVYICSICLKQISSVTKIRWEDIRVIEKPSHESNVSKIGTQVPIVHYPHPKTFDRSECLENPVRFFAILSMQRSGSGWFETLLNSHVNVTSNGEIFAALERRKNVSAVMDTLDKVYNLDWLTSASKNECSAAVGFKWMLNQGVMEYHQDIVKYFNRRGVSAVFLFRKNLLRRLVSVIANSHDRYAKSLNGTHKSHVHSEEEAETLSSYKPTINSTSLISDLKNMEAAAVNVLRYFGSTRHMVLYYEDLITNRMKMQGVLDFLNLPRVELTSRQVKIHKGPLSKHLKNWEDVNKTLNGTAYEKFLVADY